jgi:hypothetical protein
MYQKVFKAGKYGDFEVTADMLKEIADNYDTTYKKSPVNIDHWGSESYGWIEAVQVNGDYLEAVINFTDEGKALLATGKYKYPSVELVDYDGKPYLRAIALTNYNRVKNLPELQFSETNIRRFAEPSCKITFDKVSENKNSNIKMKKLIKQLAVTLSMDYSEDTADETVLQKCVDFVDDALAKLKAFADEGVSVEKFKEMKTSIDSFSDQRAEDLISSAIASNKIIVAQKDKYLKLAKADYDSVADIFAEIKPGTAFTKNDIAGRSAGGDAGAGEDNKEDLSKVNYAEVLRNPEKFIGKLSDEDFEELRTRAN